MKRRRMIINIHQHLVRLAKLAIVENFRERQLRGENPDPPDLGDEAIQQTLATVLGLMAARRIDLAGASPRAKAMATHDGTAEQNEIWADLNNGLVLRAAQLNKGTFAPIGMLGQHPSVPAEKCAKQLVKWVEQGFIGFNFDPDGTGARWQGQPFTGRQWYPVFEAAEAMDVPLVIHASESCNDNFPHTAVHYLVGDTVGVVLPMVFASQLFKDFPRLRFVIPHGGGPLACQDGRFEALAAFNKKQGWANPHQLMEQGNLLVDSCMYKKRNMRALFDAIAADFILFGDESDGAFPEVINPETGDHYDNTKLYIDALEISEDDRDKVFEKNARRVYPKIEQWITVT